MDKLVIELEGFESPKTLGQCVDVMELLQAHKAHINKELKTLDGHFKQIGVRLQTMLESMNLTECAGANKRVKFVKETKYSPQDKQELIKYVVDTEGYDIIPASVNQRAIKDRIEEGEAVPGLKTYDIVKPSITNKR